MKIGYQISIVHKDKRTYINTWIRVEDVIIDVKAFANKYEDFTQEDIFLEILENLGTSDLSIEDEELVKKMIRHSLEQLCENGELVNDGKNQYSKKQEIFDLEIFKKHLEDFKRPKKQTKKEYDVCWEKLSETIKTFPKSEIKIFD